MSGKEYDLVVEYPVACDHTMVAGFDSSQEIGVAHLSGEYESGYDATFADLVLERLDRDINAVYTGNLEEVGLSQTEMKKVEELIPGNEPLESDTIYGESTDYRFPEKVPKQVSVSEVDN